MYPASQEVLRRLGSGESIDSICTATSLTRDDFDKLWRKELASRLPKIDGRKTAQVKNGVEILRDKWGIPHIFADNDNDLFFGYGFAMGQDRLWQLDYLRRKAMGRLAEILGHEALDQDLISRTIGIKRIAAREVNLLPLKTQQRLDRFSNGINSALEECRNNLPIEFDLLEYDPEPWSPIDSVAIWCEFRWYLTGRLPVIVLPELAKRTLGDGSLYRAFLTPEADDENILFNDSYPSASSLVDNIGDVVGSPEDAAGSNNWVIGGKRSTSGLPLIASDPHIAFGSVSCWYEAHLSGSTLNVAGAGYIGVPGIIFGRNKHVAWGVTNNICSQRDLYQEKVDPKRPGKFLYNGSWEQFTEINEVIAIKGEKSVQKTVRISRNGPIVDEILPLPARNTGPVSLRWLGQDFSDEISCLLSSNVANNCDEFRKALRKWQVPTFSFVFADVEGNIGYQCVGKIPIRQGWERGYRPGWDTKHKWRELVPFEGMPSMTNPAEGWIRSANNRVAPQDFPYPLSGTWSSGHRARRIRLMIEELEKLSKEDMAIMQTDVLSLRAVEALPGLLKFLGTSPDPRIQKAMSYLKSWDGKMETDQVAASIFEVFFSRWSDAIATERFPSHTITLMAEAIGGLAVDLLKNGDQHNWFSKLNIEDVILKVLSVSLDELEDRLGSDMAKWTWGSIHTINLHHYLSSIGDLSQLLSKGNKPVGGNGTTVCNTGFDPNYMAALGANWRLHVDLGENPPGLWAVNSAGQSGHPGSPNYCDQLNTWLAGLNHYLPLDKENIDNVYKTKFYLDPKCPNTST